MVSSEFGDALTLNDGDLHPQLFIAEQFKRTNIQLTEEICKSSQCTGRVVTVVTVTYSLTCAALRYAI